jgi:hypothetical protein
VVARVIHAQIGNYDTCNVDQISETVSRERKYDEAEKKSHRSPIKREKRASHSAVLRPATHIVDVQFKTMNNRYQTKGRSGDFVDLYRTYKAYRVTSLYGGYRQ